MQATPDMPTWQIFPGAGGQFRWIVSGGDSGSRPEELHQTLIPGEENHSVSRLPSMEDLLLQAYPKLLEGGGDGGVVPMFRTGSGRPVSVDQSSIRKAISVLDGGEIADRGAATPIHGSGSDGGFAMFRTGSGKSVTVRQTSRRKAASVLEEENMDRGPVTLLQGGGSEEAFPMFRTGSGKSVTVRQSSIRKATTLLEGENMEREYLKPLEGGSGNVGTPTFHSGSGKPVLLKQSSIRKAFSVLQDGETMERDQMPKYTVDGERSFSNCLYQTGSGKTVNISSAGLIRATTLLGLDENYDISTSRSFEHAMDQSSMNITTKRESSDDKFRLGVDPGPRTDNKLSFLPMDTQSVPRNSLTSSKDLYSSGNRSEKDALQNLFGPEVRPTDSAQPPIKFQTAGGRSILISSDALQRARSLLGDSELEVLQNDVKFDRPLFSVLKDEKSLDETSWNKENMSVACLHPDTGMSKHMAKLLPSVRSFSNTRQSSSPLRASNSRHVMLNQVNANGNTSEGICRPSSDTSHMQTYTCKNLYATHIVDDNLRMLPERRPSVDPLVDISNSIGADYGNKQQLTSEKKRLGRRTSVSPFKRPRISRFTTPLNSTISFRATGSSMLSISEDCSCKTRVSTHYPSQLKRKTIKEFFARPPHHDLLGHLPYEVKHMNADNAEKYKFPDASCLDGIGPEAFKKMLLQSGASSLSATKEWIANHYKWIVWKLACLERCYPAHASGKYLTVSNVLEELKYRYEREVNYGHRSAVKKILDGDASAATMIVLCVSAIRSYPDPISDKMDHTTDSCEENKNLKTSNGAESSHVLAKVELTDGWYSLDAFLDVPLSKQLAAGKLFLGQKLRIWGAGLCGWVGPVSSLEASKTVSLLININGTYRAHWAESLGFRKGPGAPLAFRCIKGAGGKVPWTLVGVTRIYPVLYKGRFPDGGSIVRSERMEKKMLQLYNQRRSSIADDIMSDQHDVLVNDDDSEEGAKICKILESAAEPEVLMADMSSEQLISFSTYQAKQQAIRQSNMQKKIEKALEDAGLNSREVTPFMRVRVVGLTSKGSSRKERPREGLVTIWNPTENQKVDLVEGQIYSVAGLMPLNFGSDIIYLQARGSSTIWKSLSFTALETFETFFIPRKSVLLSNLGEVPLASEFDIAAVIVHVGEAYLSGRQRKQWVFMTDGCRCGCELQLEESYDCLLAVSFCSPIIDNDSSALVSPTLSGMTVGLCNLVKRARDQTNHLWVAEATENSTYSLYYNLPGGSHLKETAESAQKWAKASCSTIQKLRERVLCIVGGHGS